MAEIKINLTERKTCPYCGSGSRKVMFALERYSVCRCKSCKGVFSDPYLSENEAEKVFSDPNAVGAINPEVESYYDRKFVLANSGHTFNVFEWLLDFLEKNVSGRKLLDVGFGMGFFLEKSRRRGWECKGIDFSDEYCKYAREKLGLDVMKKRLSEFRGYAGEFDAIVLWDVIEHLDNPGESLARLNGMMKKSGMLAVATPNEKSLLAFLAQFMYKASFGLIKGPLSSVYVLEHPLFFDSNSLRKLLERSGFNIVLSKQDETDLERLNLGKTKKIIVKTIFFLSRLVKMSNRIIVIAQK
ncbi:MAG: class I SAM-dependent methyltransferase [Candidatus Aureabacteria bacterium]|nr:class I SAM-dependent methyltransferase [Candidatus Auribacterota bacterium]